eukprot:TRINITY_DN12384_c0_g1_i1.p1 TRINITY_DN12384_c0_g1~~TRINITY_DN12384_c0_g1_i1.p1  ORF type:complete len:597 (+),score=168.76 TRINITY_DN12384_c0_g1_i1:85-1791(+)
MAKGGGARPAVKDARAKVVRSRGTNSKKKSTNMAKKVMKEERQKRERTKDKGAVTTGNDTEDGPAKKKARKESNDELDRFNSDSEGEDAPTAGQRGDSQEMAELGHKYSEHLELLDKAEDALEQGDIAHARKLVKRGLRVLETAIGYAMLCDLYRMAGDHNSAIVAGNKATELDPSEPKGYYALSEILNDRGDIKEARRFLRKACSLLRDSVEELGGMADGGDKAEPSNDDDEVEEKEEAVASLVEEKRNMLGVYLMELYELEHVLGDHKAAVVAVIDALKAAPYFPEAWRVLGSEGLRALGRNDKKTDKKISAQEIEKYLEKPLGLPQTLAVVEAVLNKASNLYLAREEPVPLEVWTEMADVHMRQKNYAVAAEILQEKLTELFGSDKTGAGGAGSSGGKKGQQEEDDHSDDEDSSSNADGDGSVVDAYLMLGEAYRGKGDLAQAEKVWTEAVNSSHITTTMSGPIHHALALLLYQQDRAAQALQHASKATRAMPDVAMFHLTEGDVLVEQGKWAGAAAAYSMALDIEPDNVEAKKKRKQAEKELAGSGGAGNKIGKGKGGKGPARR